jgi:hypothetical protein
VTPPTKPSQTQPDHNQIVTASANWEKDDEGLVSSLQSNQGLPNGALEHDVLSPLGQIHIIVNPAH